MAQGTHLLASQEDDHLCQVMCILVQYQTKVWNSEMNNNVKHQFYLIKYSQHTLKVKLRHTGFIFPIEFRKHYAGAQNTLTKFWK